MFGPIVRRGHPSRSDTMENSHEDNGIEGERRNIQYRCRGRLHDKAQQGNEGTDHENFVAIHFFQLARHAENYAGICRQPCKEPDKESRTNRGSPSSRASSR